MGEGRGGKGGNKRGGGAIRENMRPEWLACNAMPVRVCLRKGESGRFQRNSALERSGGREHGSRGRQEHVVMSHLSRWSWRKWKGVECGAWNGLGCWREGGCKSWGERVSQRRRTGARLLICNSGDCVRLCQPARSLASSVRVGIHHAVLALRSANGLRGQPDFFRESATLLDTHSLGGLSPGMLIGHNPLLRW